MSQTILRLEIKWYDKHVGLYQTGFYISALNDIDKGKLFSIITKHDDDEHPSIWEDFTSLDSSIHLSGFNSIEKMIVWFGREDLEKLLEIDNVVVKQIFAGEVVRSITGKQILFDKRTVLSERIISKESLRKTLH